MEWMVALIALSVMEIVLGIDNIVFLAVVTGKLPEAQRSLARRLGLLAALVMRLALLFAITFVMKMTTPVFYLTDLGVPESWFVASVATESEMAGSAHPLAATAHHPPTEDVQEKLSQEMNAVSWRDIILIAGGLFLIWNSVTEIHEKLDRHESEGFVKPVASFTGVLVQIAVLDIIFSLDSVITAVGMAEELWIMVTAVVLSVGVMLLFANKISDFVSRNPTLVMLALSFLILIGVMLVAEGVGTHVNKGYIYFAMAFSLIVELLNLRARRVRSSGGQLAPAGSK